jgi:uncharacterized membrane protein
MKLERLRPRRLPRPPRIQTPWICLIAGLAAIALTPVAGEGLLQNNVPHLPSELNRIPDKNQENDSNAQQAKKQNFEAANAERKKQISLDSAKLLKLATDLKAEVDKTTKDTLSLTVIRKADEIERLARNVKEKMKLTAGRE